MREIGEVCEGVSEVISNATDDSERMDLAEKIRSALNRELMKATFDDPDMACPVCGGHESVRCGLTATGTQRWRCKDCGKVCCHVETGNIMALTKFQPEKWEAYIPHFLAHTSCEKIAIDLGITKRTAWFMRVRILEALYNDLPAFEVKDGCGAQVDEIYLRESFKGTRFDSLENPPREARRGDGKDEIKHGISND